MTRELLLLLFRWGVTVCNKTGACSLLPLPVSLSLSSSSHRVIMTMIMNQTGGMMATFFSLCLPEGGWIIISFLVVVDVMRFFIAVWIRLIFQSVVRHVCALLSKLQRVNKIFKTNRPHHSRVYNNLSSSYSSSSSSSSLVYFNFTVDRVEGHYIGRCCSK